MKHSHLQQPLPFKYVTQNSARCALALSKCQMYFRESLSTHPKKGETCRLNEPQYNIQVCLPCGYFPNLKAWTSFLFLQLKPKLLETLTLYPSHQSLFLVLGGLLSGESIYKTRGGEEWHSSHRSPTQPCSAPDGKPCDDGRSAWQDREEEWWGLSITAKALSAWLKHFFFFFNFVKSSTSPENCLWLARSSSSFSFSIRRHLSHDVNEKEVIGGNHSLLIKLGCLVRSLGGG